ncbi:MAG: hypothetical protein ACTSO7_17365 [Candidatus Heimdallarchaeota archaeon]
MVESIQVAQKHTYRRKFLAYKFGLKGSTEIFFWSDRTITINGIIKQGFVSVSWRIQQFIELKTNSPLKAIINTGQESIHSNLIIRKRIVNGKLVSYLIYEMVEKKFLKKQNKGRNVSIEFLAEDFVFTPLLQTISRYTKKSGNPDSFRLFLEEPLIAKKATTKTKIDYINRCILLLNKYPEPKIEISLPLGESLTLFEDSIIALQMTVNETATVISLPKALDSFLTKEKHYIFSLRNGVLNVSKIYFNDYSKNILVTSPGKVITLLWGGCLVKPEFYSKFISSIEKNPWANSKLYFGLLQLSHRPDYIKLQDTYYALIDNESALPIMREYAQTSYHSDKKFEQKIRDLLTNSPRATTFLFEEALLQSLTTNFQKIVDWFLVHTNPDLRCFTFEIKTLKNFDHKTKKLKQVIAEYAYLHSQIPEAGLPIVIINWVITDHWRYYAGLFGVILFDNQDVQAVHSFPDFLDCILQYQDTYLYTHKLLRSSNLLQASQIITQALERGVISCEMIQQYSNYLGITIDSFKNLLTFYQVMTDAAAINRYHDHKPVLIDNPTQLLQLRNELHSNGTAILIEEELAFCRKRLAKSRANPELALSSQSVVTRRRWTYDVDKLQALSEDLSMLYSQRSYWASLEPLRIQLYSHSNNEGQTFEQLVYQLLRANGHQVIRNVVVRIGPMSQEIDLVSYYMDTLEGNIIRFLISCTDKSTIQPENLKTNVMGKFYLLDKLVKYHQNDYLGLLFVYVPKVQDEYIDKLVDEFQEIVSDKIDIIFVSKATTTLRSVSSGKCHREVSFESIYIVKRVFGAFVLIIYRKVTIRIEKTEKKE